MSFITQHWWLWLTIFIAAYASVFVCHARMLKRGRTEEGIRRIVNYYSIVSILIGVALGLTILSVVLNVIDYAR